MPKRCVNTKASNQKSKVSLPDKTPVVHVTEKYRK